MQKGLTIGKAAKRAGIGRETVRFYERLGLIEPPPRTVSGYRQYSEETVSRLLFIRRAKELGFSLKEIRELLALRRAPGVSSGDIRQQAESKIADIEGKIRDLQKMKKTLAGLTASCPGRGPLSECPILGAMEPGEEAP